MQQQQQQQQKHYECTSTLYCSYTFFIAHGTINTFLSSKANDTSFSCTFFHNNSRLGKGYTKPLSFEGRENFLWSLLLDLFMKEVGTEKKIQIIKARWLICRGLTVKSMAYLSVTGGSVYVRMKLLLWFVADITKNVLKEHAKAFSQVFEHARKDLQKVHKYAWLSSQPSAKGSLGYASKAWLKDKNLCSKSDFRLK